MYFSLLKVVLGMVGVQSGMFGVLWQILCLRVFWCILGVFYVYIRVLLGILGIHSSIFRVIMLDMGVPWGMLGVLWHALRLPVFW